MADTYDADTGRIANGIKLMNQISALVDETVREFYGDVRLTADWPGVNDSTAKELRPQEEKERHGAVNTGEAISKAVVGVVKGTHVNLTNINTTQSDNLDAIHHANGGNKSRR